MSQRCLLAWGAIAVSACLAQALPGAPCGEVVMLDTRAGHTQRFTWLPPSGAALPSPITLVLLPGAPARPGMDACEGRTPHGFLEQEAEVATGIARFVRGSTYQGPAHSYDGGMTVSDFSAPADVLVLQHLVEDGPGFLGEWLDAQGIPWHLRCAETGEDYPASVRGYRGVAVLGGAWSANDERPTLRQAEALVLEADALGIPVIGHCLGGQLMARAFGGRVERLPQPEVGWWPIERTDSPAAREWLGEPEQAQVYQWHQDNFVELPPGAELIASSSTCAHQAFALRQHLAMQFHIEITPAKIQDWMEEPGHAYPVHVLLHRTSVQDPASMHAATLKHQAGSEALADRIYRVWRSRWPGGALLSR